MSGPSDYQAAMDLMREELEEEDQNHVQDEDEDAIEVVTGDAWAQLQKRKALARSLSQLPSGHTLLKSVGAHGDAQLKPGMSIELASRDFMRIVRITRELETNNIALHGLIMRRARWMSAQAAKARGELSMVINTYVDDKRPDFESGVETRPLSDFVAIRDIVLTNRPKAASWGAGDYRDRTPYATDEEHWERGRLVCRWKNVRIHAPRKGDRKGALVVEKVWAWLRNEEADEGYGMVDAAKTEQRLRRNMKAREQRLRKLNAQLTTKVYETWLMDSECRKVSAADLYAGMGGVTGALDEAGLDVKWVLDEYKWAAETQQLNFPRARVYHEHSHDFVVSGRADQCAYAAILHLSPPCQNWAHCHTIPSEEKDDACIATLLATGELIKRLWPRFVTLEQTSGLWSIKKHQDYFNMLLKSFTDEGYNVRLGVKNLAEHDSPHSRKRLIAIASWYVTTSSM